AGGVPSWAELPVQYVDYTLWQRELLGSEQDPESVSSRQSEFWRGALEGLPEELVLPVDRPRAALAREAGATSFMVVQAALAALLTRMGAGKDIPLGAVVAGRTDEGVDELVGLLVHHMGLRAD